MMQVRLIFWKDVRCLWRELSLYAVLLVVFAVTAPHTWPDRAPSDALVLFNKVLQWLIALSWLVLIALVVHADSVVGEEQFWLTRPYRWEAMLGAKLLFVAACVILPFVVMQWTVLLSAGLNPFAAKAGMTESLLKFLLINWLPFMVIASVTDGLASAFTFAVGLIVVWGGMLTVVLSGTEVRTSPPYEWLVFGLLIGGLLFCILCYQYARRRTLHSRLLIAGVLALFLLFVFGFDNAGFGTPVKALIRGHYPESGSLRLVSVGAVPYDERAEDMRVPKSEIEIKLPLQLRGFPQGARLRNPSVAVVLDDGGSRYAPAWQTASLSENTVGFLLPIRVFDGLVGRNASLHLELIGEELRPARLVQSVVRNEFPGPFAGRCSFANGKIYCRYAYHEATAGRMEASTCGGDVAARLRQVPAGTMPDPVVNEVMPSKGRFCAGDSIRFTEYTSAGRFRVVLDLAGIKIEQYRAR
jgi:hypothetical protein